ncbi:hypothetical protein [Nostoc sp. FACHB-190]|uniref:hypothetical protein n=1 Tax=Nostoc sp. FACHB-190 TaxID=2692838 RepID=UPI001685AAEE|nr:hypothetical protein [Nostoc sp. FACHB-190]MBD2298657.1 hypothetical protein [Nostoc sp. FACHB-190]
MSRVHELLNQIIKWVQQYNSEEWHKVNLDPGLTLEQIQNYYAEQPFILPCEIVQLREQGNH